MGQEEERTEKSREQAAEKSLRPDIQGGALRMNESDEPEEHEHPSYRRAADEDPDPAAADGDDAR